MKSTVIWAVRLRRSAIIGAGTSTSCMPPAISLALLSLSACADATQNSGSSLRARSLMTFWLAGEIFFQVSLLIVTISDDQAWLVAWKYFRNSQNLPSTPETDE